MPTIPTVQADEASNRPQGAPRFSGEQFGAQTGAALENLGDAITRSALKLNDIYQEVQARSAITGAQKELGDYQQELKTGPLDENGQPQVDKTTGLPVGPPPVEQHAQLMQDKIDEVRQKYSDFGTFGGQASRMFSASFEQHANAQLLETKAHAVTLLNQKIDSQFQLDLQQRANSAVTADPLVRHTAEHETQQYIDRMVDSGVITPEEGFRRKENFVEQVELGTIRNIMKQPQRPDGSSGATDVIKAIDQGEFNGLKADVLQRNREIAINQDYTNRKRSIEEVQFAEHQEEHARKEADRQTSLELTAKLGNRTLTMADVQSKLQKGLISPESAMVFTKAAAGGDTLPSDGPTKYGLANRVFNGEDATSSINAAVRNGTLTANDGIELRQKQTEFTNTFKANPGAKREMEYIHGMMGGDSLTKLPSQNAAEAQVKQAFYEEVQKNPKATPEQLHDAATRLVQRASIFSKEDMPTTMLAPKFFPGSKADLLDGDKSAQSAEGLKSAFMATEAAYKKGQISKSEYDRELKSIGQWGQALAPVVTKAAGKKK